MSVARDTVNHDSPSISLQSDCKKVRNLLDVYADVRVAAVRRANNAGRE
jgi:hypothetical protein